MKFLDLFSGIGGIKIGFEKAGFECVYSNDFDKYCKLTYDLNFSQPFQNLHEMVLGDVRSIPSSNFPDFDVLTAGFPCQPFSIAGHKMGFDDKGRGDLFFDIVRILKHRKPRGFLLENVKNLKTHSGGQTLKIIYKELEKLGYLVTDAVLNTMDYGNIPQNRERIYIVGFFKKDDFEKFSFPGKNLLKKTIHDCLEQDIDKGTTTTTKTYTNN